MFFMLLLGGEEGNYMERFFVKITIALVIPLLITIVLLLIKYGIVEIISKFQTQTTNNEWKLTLSAEERDKVSSMLMTLYIPLCKNLFALSLYFQLCTNRNILTFVCSFFRL